MAWRGRACPQLPITGLMVLMFAYVSLATDCYFLQGCLSCSSQHPQPRAPILPGYKGMPSSRPRQVETADSLRTDSKTRSLATIAGTEAGGDTAAAVQSAIAGSDGLLVKARTLLRDTRAGANAANVGQATQAEPQISGYSLSDAVHTNIQQSTPQSNPGPTVASASAFGASAANVNSNSPRTVHAAGAVGVTAAGAANWPPSVPLVLAPAASNAAVSGSVPLAYPGAAEQPQTLSILTSDPEASGPHPWDVLLFKTNQFNTTRPAYRLGGLGLMLMADFNKSQPLTDWHAVDIQPQQQQQLQAAVNNKVSQGSSGSSSGQGHGVLGQLGQMMKKAVQNNGKIATAVQQEGGQNLKPPSLVEQLKSMLQKLNKANTNTAADKDAVFSIASVDGSKRLWCTACESPTYTLSEFGYCVCSPGYGRLLDSKSPYACVACPAGYISSNSSVLTAEQHTGPTEIRLEPPSGDDLDPHPAVELTGSVLSVCRACPKGTQANQQQSACVAP